MRLKVEIGLYLTRIVEQNIVHRDIVGTQILRPVNDPHTGEIRTQAGHHRLRIGVNNHLGNLGDRQHGFNNVVEEGLAGKRPVILARHALAMMPHGHQGGNFHASTFLSQSRT